jgi:hypothetical protein
MPMPNCRFDADGFFRCAPREGFSDTPRSDAPSLDIRLSKGGVPINGSMSRIELPYSSTRRNSFVTALNKDTRWQTVKIDAKCPACPAAESCPEQKCPEQPHIYIYWTDVPSPGDVKVIGGINDKKSDRFVCMVTDEKDRNFRSIGLTDPSTDHKQCIVSVRGSNKDEMTVANTTFMYLVKSSTNLPVGKNFWAFEANMNF